MKTDYRRLLMAGGMIGLAMPAGGRPAFAQPANLLAPLTGQTPVGQTPVGQTPVGQTAVAQTLGGQPATASYPGYQPFLAAAHDDVARYRWNAAEAALERSETFLLNYGVKSSMGVATSPSLAMPYIIQARASVAQRDQVDALLAIDKAMSAMSAPATAVPPAALTEVLPPPSSIGTVAIGMNSAVSVPMVTKALLPGHWQLAGWQYHWVPPDTSYRPVQTNTFIPGHYEYRGGAWIWVGGHYGES
jgi:hypothetical protein